MQDNQKKKITVRIGLYGLSLLVSVANADILTLDGQVENQITGQSIFQIHSYGSYDDVRKALESAGEPDGDFYNIITGYESQSDLGIDPAAVINANVFGASLRLSGAANDPSLHLSSSDIHVDRVFNGKTREESLQMLYDWAKTKASDLIKRLNSLTPLNAVAGTPFSAQGIGVTQDFSFTENTAGSIAADGVTENRVSLAARFSNYTIGDKNANVITLPLGYAWNFRNGYALIFNLPLTYADIGGMPSYSASLGMGLKLPVSNWLPMEHSWTITPIFRVGAVGSDKNVADASILYSGGLLSEYDMPLASGILGFKNMYSYYVTSSVSQYLDLKVNNIKINVPDITNSIFKNGVYYSRYLGPQFLGRKLSGTVFFADTRFTGSLLYADSQQEVGFNFGLAPNDNQANSTGSFLRRQLNAQDLRLGFSYTSANQINGFSANFGFTF